MVKTEKVEMPVYNQKAGIVFKEANKRKVYISRLKRKFFKHVWIIRGSIIIGIVVFLFLAINLFGKIIKRTQIPYYYSLASSFIFAPKGVVDEVGGRTNILIMGKGGEGHEAPDLTDTMLFLSLDHENKKMTMISLPRDIWLPDLRTKLNSVYYWGNKKEPPIRRASGPEEAGGGIILAKSSVEEIVGKHVHYAVVLDFSGFTKIIDVLGGIEVDVENSFVDKKYPIPGLEEDLCDGDQEYKCRYETLHFTQGKQVMDGETALKFARSRNAEGDEGTDFARQKRQQKIIEATKKKILEKDTIFSPKKLLQLKNAVVTTLETDLDEKEGAIITRLVFDSKDDISSHILPEELLVNPPKSVKYDNLYVFIPRMEDPSMGSSPNWSEVHNWVECILEGGSECL